MGIAYEFMINAISASARCRMYCGPPNVGATAAISLFRHEILAVRIRNVLVLEMSNKRIKRTNTK
jgi:hypothetical protein